MLHGMRGCIFKFVSLVLKAQGKTDDEIAEFERQIAALSAND